MDGKTRRTQLPCVDMSVVIPELAPMARVAVRLHPRRGEVSTNGSKIGGLFLWPSHQKWPRCQDHNCPLIAILQLHKKDVPELVFPEGTDLFQLLWCSECHEQIFVPSPQIFWRMASDVAQTVSPLPTPFITDQIGSPLPTPCRLFPERVIEYPHAFELHDNRPELWAVIENSPVLREKASQEDSATFEDAGSLYSCCLSVADGSKIGGYVNWCQSPETPVCSCGSAMEHLLTIADMEFDGGTWKRWLPEEEKHVWQASPDQRFAVQMAANFSHGGKFYLFICRTCKTWPVQAIFQCD